MIKEFLNTQIGMYERFGHPALLERFIFNNGASFSTGTEKVRLRTIKQCFKNSTHLVMENSQYRYVEGYIARENFPILIHHAWVINDNDEVIDSTLRDQRKIPVEYFGVIISRDDLFEQIGKNGVYGILDTGMINVEYLLERDSTLKRYFDEFKKKGA